MKKIEILGLDVDAISVDDLRLFTEKSLIGENKVRISKVNTEFIVRAVSDPFFMRTINSSDLVVVDGRGVQWAAKYLSLSVTSNNVLRYLQVIFQMVYSGAAIVLNPSYIKSPIEKVIPGVEALEIMLSAAERSGSGVFFFGASDDVLRMAVNNMKFKFPDLVIAGLMNGYDYQTNNKVDPIKEINKTDARLLIVGLGSPKQEYWIKENLSKLKNIKVAVGEGGTLDRMAYPGQIAPMFINKIGLEWLWRLTFNKSKTETRNRIQRFWRAVPLFIFKVVRRRISK